MGPNPNFSSTCQRCPHLRLSKALAVSKDKIALKPIFSVRVWRFTYTLLILILVDLLEINPTDLGV